MKFVSKNRTHSRKAWAAILAISMMLQFFLPFTGPLKPVPVRAEEETAESLSPAVLESLDLSDKLSDRDNSMLRVGVGEDEGEPLEFSYSYEDARFKNVKHKLYFDPADQSTVCQRTLTGEIEFDWPEPSHFVDVHVIQDLSGSFEGSIVDVGNVVGDIIDELNMGTDVDGVSPKDRFTLTSFRGAQGVAANGRFAIYNFITQDVDLYDSYSGIFNGRQRKGTTSYINVSSENGKYQVKSQKLCTDKTSAEIIVSSIYKDTNCDGGTPTVDGLVEAQDHYKRNVIDFNKNYNLQKYEVVDSATDETVERKRDTVYLLITDGAANVAKYNNIPNTVRDELTLYRAPAERIGYTDYYTSNGWQYGVLNPVFSGNPNRAYGWRNFRKEYFQDYYVPSNRDDIVPMLEAQKIIAANMREHGGVKEESNDVLGGKASLVVAFWEDLNSIEGSPDEGLYESGDWKTARDNYIKPAFNAMTGDEDLVVLESDMGQFATNLLKAFRTVASPVFDQIKLDLNQADLVNFADENSDILQIFKQKTDGVGTPIFENGEPVWEENPVALPYNPLNQLKDGESQLVLDMSKFDHGKYKIIYHVKESKYKPDDYVPGKLSAWFEGEESVLMPAEDDTTSTYRIPGNPYDKCGFTVDKDVSLDQSDWTKQVTVDKLYDPFYFKVDYFISKDVENYTEGSSIVLSDAVDNRIDVKDAQFEFIPKDLDNPGSPPGESIFVPYDVNAMTPNPDDEDYVMISLELPFDKPLGDGAGRPQNLTEMAGWDVVLHINGQLKKDISPERFEQLFSGDKNNILGVINRGYITSQKDGSTTPETKISRVVGVLFPEPKAPTIEKYVSTRPKPENENDRWNGKEELILLETTSDYEYRIKVTFPNDMGAFENFTVKDVFNDAHVDIDLNNIQIKTFIGEGAYGEAVESNVKLNPTDDEFGFTVNYQADTPDPGQQQIEFVGVNLDSTLCDLGGKTVVFAIPANLRDGFNRTEYFDSDNNPTRVEVPNQASFEWQNPRNKPTEPTTKKTGIVKVIPPLPKLTIAKKDDADPANNLSGATFTIQRILPEPSGSVQELVASGEDLNEFTTDPLLPGRTYKIIETKAPTNYQLPENTAYLVTVDDEAKVTVKKQEGETETEITLTNSVFNVPNQPVEPVLIRKYVNELGLNNLVIDAADPYYGMGTPEATEKTKESADFIDSVKKSIKYTLEIKIPDNTSGINKLTVEDQAPPYFILKQVDPGSGDETSNFKIYVRDESGNLQENTDIVFDIINTENVKQFVIDDPSEIKKLAGKILCVQFEMIKDETASLDDLKAAFGSAETEADYYIPNRASVQLNEDGPKENSNTVYSRFILGKAKFAKQLQDLKEDGSDYEEPRPVTEDHADDGVVFELFKIVDGQETHIGFYTPTIDENGSYIIANDLEPGRYYFKETSSPLNYKPHEGKIPNDEGFVISDDKVIHDDLLDGQAIINKQAKDPTILKLVGPDPDFENNTDTLHTARQQGNTNLFNDYHIEYQVPFRYTITASIPAGAAGPLEITDTLPRYLVVQDQWVHVADQDSELFEPVAANHWLNKNLKVTNSKSRATVELPLVKGGETEPDELQISGKKIRITLVCQVRSNKIFDQDDVVVQEGDSDAKREAALAVGGMMENGHIPNRAYLKRGDETVAQNDADILPRALRTIEFKKIDGAWNAVQHAEFALYRIKLSDTEQKFDYLDENGEPTTDKQKAQYGPTVESDAEGFVRFKDVLDGTYLLEEITTPAPYFEEGRLYRVVVPQAWKEGTVNYFSNSTSNEPLPKHNFGSETSPAVYTYVWNNETVKISGKKVWEDPDYAEALRPPIKIQLRRSHKEGETIVSDTDFKPDPIELQPDGTFSFEDLEKYYDVNKPYTYEVTEIDLTNDYESSQKTLEDGTIQLTNTLKEQSVQFKKVKVDGETVTALPGVQFELYRNTGTKADPIWTLVAENLVSSDPDGLITVDNLAPGDYLLKEIPHTFVEGDERFIQWEEQARFTVETPTEENPNPITVDFGMEPMPDVTPPTYQIANYPLPEPKKQIKQGEDWVTKNTIGKLTDDVVYRIVIPLGDTSDIHCLKITDQLTRNLGMIGGQINRAYYWDNASQDKTEIPLTDYDQSYDYDTNNILTVNFDLNDEDREALKNKHLAIEYTARMQGDVAQFKENYPDNIFKNQAVLTLNNLPDNQIETNEVQTSIKFVSVQFEKTFDDTTSLDWEAIWANGGYRFRLHNETTGMDVATFARINNTDPTNRVIKFTDLDVGTYVIYEDKAPEPFMAMDPIRFNIVLNDSGKPVVTGIEATETSEGSYLFDLGSKINKLPEKPEIDKKVKGEDEDEENADDNYTMPDREKTFDYIVKTTIPESVKGYTELVIDDPFPASIVFPEGKQYIDLSVDGGVPTQLRVSEEPGFDSGTVSLGKNSNETIEFTYDLRNHDASLSQYILKLKFTDSAENKLEKLAGRTIKLVAKMQLSDTLKALPDFKEYSSDGLIHNTAFVSVNGLERDKDKATVTPSPKYGASFKKLIQTENNDHQPGYFAGFVLEEIDLATVDTEGTSGLTAPKLPTDVKRAVFMSDDDGVITIPRSLDAGSYYLKEVKVPQGYYQDGKLVEGPYAVVLDTYILTVGEDGTTIQRVDAEGLPITGETPPTPDDLNNYPELEIVNRELTTAEVTKTWEDNQYLSTRPETITLVLKRFKQDENGKYIADNDFNTEETKDFRTVILPVSNSQQTYTFRTVIDDHTKFYVEPFMWRFDENGKPYQYRVEEILPDDAIYEPDYEYSEDGRTTTITNKLKAPEFTLYKIEAKEKQGDPDTPLAGITFTITTTQNESTIVNTFVTDADGEIVFKENKPLAPGHYKIYESATLPGYILDPTVYDIIVEEVIDPEDPTATKTMMKVTVTDPEGNEMDLGDETQNGIYKLTLTNKKQVGEKKVNGQDLYNLKKQLTEVLSYTISVPVSEQDGLHYFKIEDTLNDLLVFCDGTGDTTKAETAITVTANGTDIKDQGELTLSGQTLTFEVGDANLGPDDPEPDSIKSIKGKEVVLTFNARIKDDITLEEVKQQITDAGDADIPNDATITFNNTPSKTEKVHVVPEEPTEPEISKKVQDSEDYVQDNPYQLHHRENVVTYDIEVPIPEDVLGYVNLSIEDLVEPILEVVSDSITLKAVEQSGTSETLVQGTDYNLTNDPKGKPAEDPSSTEKIPGTWLKATLVPGFDYTRIAGKTLVLSFKAKIKSDPVDIDFTKAPYDQYVTDRKGTPKQIPFDALLKDDRIIIPNQAKLIFGDETQESNAVCIEPPRKPDIDKKVSSNQDTNDVGEQNGPKDILNATNEILANPLTYTVDVTLPLNLAGVREFTVSDELSDVFKTIQENDVTFWIEDDGQWKAPENLDPELAKPIITITGKKVTATVSKIESVEKYAGKKVRLQINATIDPDKDISEYLEVDTLNNRARIDIKDRPGNEDDAKVIVKTGTIDVIKQSDQGRLPEGTFATFALYKKAPAGATAQNPRLIGHYITEQEGEGENKVDKITVTGLLPGEYYFKEVEAPEGHVFSEDQKEKEYRFVVEADGTVSSDEDAFTAAEGKTHAKFTVNNEKIEEIKLTLKKTWKDDKNADQLRPETLTFKITQYIKNTTTPEGGEEQTTYESTDNVQFVEVPVSSETDETYELPGKTGIKLPAKDAEGNTLVYTVEETKVKHYSTEPAKVEHLADKGEAAFVNTLTGTTFAKWIKIWQGGGDEHPNVTMKLTAWIGETKLTDDELKTLLGKDEVPTMDTKTEEGEERFEDQFNDLPLYNADGKKITYIVVEDMPKSEDQSDIPGGHYKFESSEGQGECGTRITNKFVPDKINVTATKTWEGALTKDVKLTLVREAGEGSTKTVDVVETVTLKKEEIQAETNQVSHTWENLDAVRNSDGAVYTYYIVEEDLGADYIVTYEPALEGRNDRSDGLKPVEEKTAEDGSTSYTTKNLEFSVTNKDDGGSTKVVAKKIWEGPLLEGQQHPTDSVYFKLIAKVDDKEVDETTYSYLLKGDDRVKDLDQQKPKATWEDLRERTKEGKTVTYEVIEVMPKPNGSEGEYVDWQHDQYEKPVRSAECEDCGDCFGWTFTNKRKVEKIDISVTKEWLPEDHTPAAGTKVTLKLTRHLQGSSVVTHVDTVTLPKERAEKWSHTWEGLDKTDEQGNVYVYDVVEVPLEDYDTEVTSKTENGKLTFTVKNTYNLTGLKIKKHWADGNNANSTRPDKIIFKVTQYLDGTATGWEKDYEFTVDTATTAEAAVADYEITDLPARDADGKEFTYKVAEQEPENYVSEDHSTADGKTVTEGYDAEFTNTLGAKTEIHWKKIWEGGSDAVRPDVTIELYDDGKLIRTHTINAESPELSGSFTDIPTYDTSNQPITYTLKEKISSNEKVTVVEGTKQVSIGDVVVGSYTLEGPTTENGVQVFKNTYTPETIDIAVEKAWQGGTPKNTSVTLKLKRTVEGSGVVTFLSGTKITLPKQDNVWTHTWTGLDKADAQGRIYTYSVVEEHLEGYKPICEPAEIKANATGELKFTVTNYSDLTERKVKKIWDDSSNKYKTRPREITFIAVQYYKDDMTKATGWTKEFTFTVGEGDEQNFTLTDLPALDVNNKEYAYKILEKEIPNYESQDVSGQHSDVDAAFKNSLKQVTEVKWQKIWAGGPTQDVPSATIKLHARLDGETEDLSDDALAALLSENYAITKEVTAGTDQEGSFANLPLFTTKLLKKVKINYRVTEEMTDRDVKINGVKIGSYTVSDPTDQDGVQVFTNTYTPEQIELKVTKQWAPKGHTPAADQTIKVKILQTSANGTKQFGDTIVLPKDNAWTTTVSNVPMTDEDGNVYSYSVEEIEVPQGYDVNYEPASSKKATEAVVPVGEGESETTKQLAFTVTNTYDQGLTDVTARKIWAGPPLAEGETYPNDTVYFKLVAKVGNTEVTDEQYKDLLNGNNRVQPIGDNLEVVWKDLRKQTATGKDVLYTVEEVQWNATTEKYEPWVNDDYESPIYGTQCAAGKACVLTVTNTRKVETVDIPVQKEWPDGEPTDTELEITVKLKRTLGSVTEYLPEEKTLNAANQWKATWEGVDKTNATGQVYSYSVVEVVPEGYRASYEPEKVQADAENLALTIKNHANVTSRKVKKIWVDNNNASNTRPEKITFTVTQTRNGQPTDWVKDYEFEVDTSADGNEVTYIIEELPAVDADNKAYDYTIVEKTGTLPNYSSEKAYDEESKLTTFTNTLTGTIDIPWKKVWDGGTKTTLPEITIELYKKVPGAEDQLVETQTINAANPATEGVFEGFAQYDDNQAEIDYFLKEVMTDGTAKIGDVVVGSFKPATDDPQYDEGVWTFTNTFEAKKIKVAVDKSWGPKGHTPADNVTVQVRLMQTAADGTTAQYGEEKELNKANGWKAEWTEVPMTDQDGNVYTYKVEEVTLLEGYTQDPNTKTEGLATGAKEDTLQLGLKNIYRQQNVSLTVEKSWENGTPPESIEVQLMQETETGKPTVYGDAVTLTKDDNNKWTYTWNDIPIADDAGNAYLYSVREVAVPEGYTADYGNAGPEAVTVNADGSAENLSLVIKNTYDQGTTSVTAKKVWVGGDTVDKPDVYFKLTATVTDGTYELPKSVEAVKALGDGTSVTWNELDATTTDGKAITYNVEEVMKTSNEGEPAVYEPWNADGFITTQDGLTFTNTYKPDQIDIKVTKEWVGGPETDHTEIKVQLIRKLGSTTEEVGEPKALNAANNWTETWMNQDKTDAAGKEYTYSVKELNVPSGYTSKVSSKNKETGDGEDVADITFTIENTYDQGTTTVKAVKDWTGPLLSGDEYPTDTVWFKLTATVNEAEVDVTPYLAEGDKSVKKAENNTVVSWTGLKERTAEGKTITYSVKEVDAAGNDWANAKYKEPKIEGTDGNFTVTNERKIQTISITVEKEWENGQPLNELEVELIQKTENGKPTTYDTVTLEKNTEGKWTHTWTDVPASDANGNIYQYSVREVTVPEGFNADYSAAGPKSVGVDNGQAKNLTLTIKNTYNQGTTSVKAMKQWQGNPPAGLTFPDVYLKLTATVDGAEVDVKPYLAAGDEPVKKFEDGAVTWDNLKKTTSAGKPIEYSVVELMKMGDGYVAWDHPYVTPGKAQLIDGVWTVINTYAPAETVLYVEKTWADNMNAANTRPDTITFKVTQSLNGEVTGTFTFAFKVTAETETYEIKGLPEVSADNTKYVYTIEEVVPAGYEQTAQSGNGTATDPWKFTNTLIEKPQLTIQKVDDSDPAQPLENAYFELRSNTHVVVMKSDELGIATFPDLPDGEYTLIESKAPDLYEGTGVVLAKIKVENHKISLVENHENVTVKGEADKELSFEIKNIKRKTRLVVNKVNNLGEFMPNVSFIFNEGKPDQKTLTTDANGQLVLEDLAPGTYTLQEAGTVPGYVPNDAVYEIEVDTNLNITVDGRPVQDLTVVNQKDDNSLIVIKLDEDTKQALEGATFALLMKDEPEAETRDVTVNLVKDPAITDAIENLITVQLTGNKQGKGTEPIGEPQTFADQTSLTFNASKDYIALQIEVTLADTIKDQYTVDIAVDEVTATFTVTVKPNTDTDTVTTSGLSVDELTTQYNETLEIQNQAIADYNQLLEVIETLGQEIVDMTSGNGGSNESPTATGTSETTETTASETTETTAEETTESTPAETTEGTTAETTAETSAETTGETTAETTTSETENTNAEILAEKQATYDALVQEAEAQKQAIDERQAELDTMKAELDQLTPTEAQPATVVSEVLTLNEEVEDTEAEQRTVIMLQSNPDDYKAPEGYTLIDKTLTTDVNGIVKLPDLDPGTYKLVEIDPPKGYVDDEKAIEFTVDYNATTGLKEYKVAGELVDHLVVENKRDIIWRELTITKRWHDIDEAVIPWPDGYTLEFTFYRNGVPYPLPKDSVVTGGDATIENGILKVNSMTPDPTDAMLYKITIQVPQEDKDGNVYTYSATEVINEDPNDERPYFYYPKEWKVDEVNGVIHFDNMDPYKFINIIIEKTWDVADDKLEKLPASLSFEIQRSTDNATWETVETVTLSKADAVSGNVWRRKLEKNYPGREYDGAPFYTYRVVELSGESYKQTAALSDNEGHIFTFSFTNELVEEPEPTPPEPTEPTPTEPTPTEPEPTPPTPTDPPPRVPHITVPPRPTVPEQKEASPGVITTPIPATGETRTLFPIWGLALMLALVYLRKRKRG